MTALQVLQQLSLTADRLDTGANWRVLVLSPAHHLNSRILNRSAAFPETCFYSRQARSLAAPPKTRLGSMSAPLLLPAFSSLPELPPSSLPTKTLHRLLASAKTCESLVLSGSTRCNDQRVSLCNAHPPTNLYARALNLYCYAVTSGLRGLGRGRGGCMPELVRGEVCLLLLLVLDEWLVRL